MNRSSPVGSPVGSRVGSPMEYIPDWSDMLDSSRGEGVDRFAHAGGEKGGRGQYMREEAMGGAEKRRAEESRDAVADLADKGGRPANQNLSSAPSNTSPNTSRKEASSDFFTELKRFKTIQAEKGSDGLLGTRTARSAGLEGSDKGSEGARQVMASSAPAGSLPQPHLKPQRRISTRVEIMKQSALEMAKVRRSFG